MGLARPSDLIRLRIDSSTRPSEVNNFGSQADKEYIYTSR